MRLIRINEEENIITLYDITANIATLKEICDDIRIYCGAVERFEEIIKDKVRKPESRIVIKDTYKECGKYSDNGNDIYVTGKTYSWKGWRYAATNLTNDIEQFIKLYQESKVEDYSNVSLLSALSGEKKYKTKEEIISEMKAFAERIKCMIEGCKEDFKMEPDPIWRDSYKKAIKAQEDNLELCKENIYNRELIDQNDYVKEVAKLITIEEIKKMPLDLYREALDINTGGYKLKPNNKNKTN